MSHLTKLYFCTLTAAWIDVSNNMGLLTLLLLLLLLFYVGVYGDTKCCQTSLNAAGIRNLSRKFRISPTPFLSLVTTVCLLNSFLLQTWCAIMLTYLAKHHFIKTGSSLNCVTLKWTYHQSTYCSSTSYILFFFYCCYIYVVLFVWYCRIEYMCYILVVLVFCAALK